MSPSQTTIDTNWSLCHTNIDIEDYHKHHQVLLHSLYAAWMQHIGIAYKQPKNKQKKSNDFKMSFNER